MKIKLIILTLIIGVTTSCNNNNDDNNSSSKNENLKDTAKKAQQAFFKDYSKEGVEKYFAKDYIQHNPFVPTGINTVFEFLPVLKDKKVTYKTHRLLQDGEYIIFHNTYKNAEVFGAKDNKGNTANEVVAFDVWRMKDNKVAEHWDNITFKADKNPSGRTQVDGYDKIEDLDKTDSNKKLVENFVNDILMGKNPNKIKDYISDKQYDQHNTMVADGLDGLNQALGELAKQDNLFKYKTLHKVLGEGNFVLTISEGEWFNKNQAFYDLFRVKDGKIVEHWDVIQEIPPKDKFAHKNGKFNFK